MNKIILSGRLAQDPETKQTPNGAEMATFSIAVNRRRDRETTDFLNVYVLDRPQNTLHSTEPKACPWN